MKKYLITGANGLLGKEIILQATATDKDTEFLAISNNCEKLMSQFQDCQQLKACSWDDLESLEL